MNKIRVDVAGQCPKCGSNNINYESLTIVDNGLYYPYDCEDCKFEGKEWYEIEFYAHYGAKNDERIRQQ